MSVRRRIDPGSALAYIAASFFRRFSFPRPFEAVKDHGE